MKRNIDFFKQKITELNNTCKAIASLSLLSVSRNDIEQVKYLHGELNKTAEQIFHLINLYNDNNSVKSMDDIDLKNLPDYLESMKILNAYQKMLSLKYANMDVENTDDKILLNKMSIEYNYEEEFPYLNIVRALYENGNYPEALELCHYITTISDTAPVWKLFGDIYRAIGEYGQSIGAYKTYLKLNESDEEAEDTLKEIFEESLK